ncbi:MAG: hypothetical protein Tsb0014_32520 [Pleurocapsa sp.]
MSFNPKNLEQQTLLAKQLVIAQSEQPQDQSQQDPLIDYGAEHLIDFGVVLIAFTVIIVIGMISKQTEKALLFALGLSAFLIIILWNI